MKTTFHKPDINISRFPFINRYISADYEKVESLKDIVEFIHKGLGVIETSNNDVKIACYKRVIYPLYSIMTGRSYQTKQFKQHKENHY